MRRPVCESARVSGLLESGLHGRNAKSLYGEARADPARGVPHLCPKAYCACAPASDDGDWRALPDAVAQDMGGGAGRDVGAVVASGFAVSFGGECVGVWFWFGFAFAFAFAFRWHPRIVSALHASPLCGAAPTFLCRRKEK